MLQEFWDGSQWQEFTGPPASSPLTLIAGTPTDKPLTLKGAASQSANLLEAQNSAGTILSSIGPTGNVVLQPTSGVALFINNGSGGPSTTVSAIRGAVSQTGNLQEWQDSSGNPLLSVRSDGLIVSKSGVGAGSYLLNEAAGGNVAVLRSLATNSVPLVLYGATGQTANILEGRVGASVVLGGINSAGKFFFDQSLTSASATAGVNGGLPAQVQGYWIVNLPGFGDRKVPFYNV